MQSIRAKFIYCAFFLFLVQLTVFSQFSITGPECVVTGTEYQYNVNGNLSEASTIQWCITGGIIIGSDNSCFAGNSKFIRVKWQNSNSGSIKIYTGQNNAAINVTVTTFFKAGGINTASLIQDLKKNVVPASILCSEPVGGSCSPTYEFQWYESENGMSWKAITGANAPQLIFSSKPKTTMYYRRRVRESVSNSEGVSNVAMIIVKDNK